LICTTLGTGEVGLAAIKAATIPIDFALVAAEPASLAAEASVSTSTGESASHAHTALNAAVLIFGLPCLLSFCSDHVNIAQHLDKFSGTVSNIDTLVFAVLIDVVELPKHSEEGEVGSGIVDDSFRSVLAEVFQ
jgi:hypothetical protein